MATPIYCCGGECGGLGHIALVADCSISTSTVRSGARSYRCNPTGSLGYAHVGTPNVTTTTRCIGRFYVRFATLPNQDAVIASFGISVNGPLVRFQQSDSKIYAGAGTSNGATGVSVTTGVWYRVDFDFNINTTGNDLCDVQVDGVACGQATDAGLSVNADGVRLGIITPATTADLFIDDIVLSVTGADYPIGAGKVEHFVPTADGTHNVAGAADFRRSATATDILNSTTDAYQLIDDVPLKTGTPTEYINMLAPPNATDYTEHIFGPAPGISTPTVAPRAVEVICAIAQAGTGAGNMELRLNDNGAMGTIYTATGVAGTTAISYKRAHFADPPSAATVWNVNNDGSNGDFRDLRIRFGSPAALDVNPDQYLASVMIEAEFSVAVSQTVSGVGNVSTAEAFGSGQANHRLAATGIGTAEVFGASTLNRTAPLNGIASTESFGTAKANHAVALPAIASGESFGTAEFRLVFTITVSGVASAEAFGSLTVQRGSVTISPSGISSVESFGSAQLNRTLSISSIASAETFGSPTIQRGSVTVSPSSIASSEAHGAGQVNLLLTFGGIASLESLGSPSFSALLSLTGISSLEAFGNALVNHTVSLTDLSSAEAFGSPTVQPGSVTLLPTGISSSEVVGTAWLNFSFSLSGISSSETIGTHEVTRGAVSLVLAGISTAEAIGTPTVTSGASAISVSSITSSEAFGTPQLNRTVSLSGIPSTEAVGDLTVSSGALFVTLASIGSVEAFGDLTIQRGAVTVALPGIGSGELFGLIDFVRGAVTVSTSGIVSSESFGSPQLNHSLLLSGIASATAFGVAALSNGGVTITVSGIISAEIFGTAVVFLAVFIQHPTNVNLTNDGQLSAVVSSGVLSATVNSGITSVTVPSGVLSVQVGSGETKVELDG